MSDFLRMSGVYWSLTLLDLCESRERLDNSELVDFVVRNQRSCGGFAPADGHDAHLLYTLSAIQIAATCGALERINRTAAIEFVRGLQQADGSFAGDKWGIGSIC